MLAAATWTRLPNQEAGVRRTFSPGDECSAGTRRAKTEPRSRKVSQSAVDTIIEVEGRHCILQLQ